MCFKANYLLQIFILTCLHNGVVGYLFCDEVESDIRLELDPDLLKFQYKTTPHVFILNRTHVGQVFNVTCASRRAVDWKFDGLTANSAVSIDRYRNHDATCHVMSLNFTFIDDQITGAYSCYEIARPWKSLNFTLFADRANEGPGLRLRGQTVDIRPNSEADLLLFPCGVNDPRVQVNLLEIDSADGTEKWTVISNSSFTANSQFNPIHGFTINASILHKTNYKCEVAGNESQNDVTNVSNVVNLRYHNHTGPVFIPLAAKVILPRNATNYQIKCAAPYPIYLTRDGPLTFDISNVTNLISGITSAVATFQANLPEPPYRTNVSCLRLEDDKLLKIWNVEISEMEFQPGIVFNQAAAIATCHSSTVEELEIFYVLCDTDTECKFREGCLAEKEDWKCPGLSRSPNIVVRNETSVTVDLQYRSGILVCRSSDVNATISLHVRADGEIDLDESLYESFVVEILGNRTVPTFGTVTAQCTVSKRLFYSKIMLELWDNGKLVAKVRPEMILTDEFTETPGLFTRKVTFRVPRGEFDEVICFVETYSPKVGYTKGTPLIVYQNSLPPIVHGPKYLSVNLRETDFTSTNNLTCEAENWSNISWEIPAALKLSDLIIIDLRNESETQAVSELRIPSLDSKYEGIYLCVVSNSFGLTQKEFVVHVNEAKIPWFTIAIVAGVILAFSMLMYIWWMVRKAVAVTSAMQDQHHEYPLQVTANFKGKDDENARLKLQSILEQFRNGIWPLSSEEKEAFTMHYELDFKAAMEAESGNYIAMMTPYDFEQYEVPSDCVQIESDHVLGSGEFGIVYVGRLHGGKFADPVKVAIKRLKPEADADYVSSFLKELQIMIYVGKHANMIELIGACTKSNSIDCIYIVLKHCLNGNLEKYLRTRRKVFVNQIGDDGKIDKNIGILKANQHYTAYQPINTQDLLKWTIQIAAGMEFLAEKKVIHGDLACRNVLLDENLVVKISDFGLARRLYQYTKYIKKQQALLPWRWMAIESLQDLHFSPASDVWAFGITAWEIFSLSEVPYPGIVWSIQFVEQLRAGHRNAKPQYATRDMYTIMKNCWLQDPADRPTMNELREKFSTIFASEFISTNSEYINS